MKKIMLSLAILAITFCAQAQLSTILLAPLPGAVHDTVAQLHTLNSGFTGTYQQHYIYRLPGDTLMAGVTTSTNNGNLWKDLTVLTPQTSYEVASVVADNGMTDTSSFITITTTATPPPPTAIAISNVQVNSSLGQTVVSFHYDGTGLDWDLYVLFGNQQFLSSVITVTGIGDTSITITNPNVSGVVYGNNLLVAEPEPNSWVSYQQFVITDWTVPTAQSTDVGAIGLTTSSPDSLNATATITVGNTGIASVVPKFLDGNGNVLNVLSTFTIYHDTTVQWHFGGLTNATSYGFRVIASNSGGTDSATATCTTQQVPAPEIMEWDTVGGTLTSTGIKVKFTSNGAWASSLSRGWITWYDAFGGTHTDSTGFFTGTLVDTFSLSSLYQNPTVNYATIGVHNNAGGAHAWDIQFVLLAPHAAFIPQWGTCYAVSASRIEIQSIGYSVPSGTIGSIKAAYRKDGAQYWDTVIVAGGLQGSGTIDALLTGLQGGTKYWFRLIGTSQDDLMLTNGQEKWEITLTPDFPIIADITLSQGGWTIIGTLNGSGEGTLSEVKAEVYQNGIWISESVWMPVGTDIFEAPFTLTGVSAGIIEIRGHIRGIDGGNPSTFSKWFDNGATGMQEVSFDKVRPSLISNCWNSLGQLIGEGKLPAEFLAEFGDREIFIGPQDPYYLKTYKAQHYFPQ